MASVTMVRCLSFVHCTVDNFGNELSLATTDRYVLDFVMKQHNAQGVDKINIPLKSMQRTPLDTDVPLYVL